MISEKQHAYIHDKTKRLFMIRKNCKNETIVIKFTRRVAEGFYVQKFYFNKDSELKGSTVRRTKALFDGAIVPYREAIAMIENYCDNKGYVLIGVDNKEI